MTAAPEISSPPPVLSRRAHMRAIAVLGLPLIASHVAQFSINLTDAAMLGWYNVEALAAVVLAESLFIVVFLFGSGFAFAVMPMVARAAGSGQGAQVRRVTRMGLWVSMMFAALAVPLLVLSEPLFMSAGQDPAIAAGAGVYLRIVGWSLVPALAVMVLKSYLAALEHTRVVLWVTLGAVAVNVVVNYALIFGHFGAPEMGIAGAAWASLCVHIVSALGLAVYAIVKTPEHMLFVRFWRFDGEAFVQVFRLGWPIGFTNLAEVGLFSATSIMMGWLGPVALAAHGIALQITATTFMVHLGLSNAATVRAGNAMGRGDSAHLRRGAGMVVALSLVVALLAVVVFLMFPKTLLGLFLSPDDPQRALVLAVGTELLAAAALFQVADGVQAVALGLLRGMEDTRVPMVIAVLSYWGLGAPTSYLLGFVVGWGGVGVWLGLAAGLGLAALLLILRFRARVRDIA